MSNRFGARVVGKARAAEQQQIRKHNKGRFGRRVIGDILQRKHDIAAGEEQDTRDPTAIVQKRAQAAADAEAARKSAIETPKLVETEAPVTANIGELEGALAANPTFYETLYASEVGRESGPRKGALRLFLAHELDNANRESRVEEIQDFLKG